MGREKESNIDLLFHFLIITGCLLYVPWLGIEPATLMYWDNALTHRATAQGKVSFLIQYDQ